jgi:CDGSH iron-sulfur domain-containing protein 3
MSRSAHAVTLEASKHYRWCACGRSRQPPWCDDSHQGPDERPLSFIAPRHEIVWLCGCTNTTTPPFCDGSHRQTL